MTIGLSLRIRHFQIEYTRMVAEKAHTKISWKYSNKMPWWLCPGKSMEEPSSLTNSESVQWSMKSCKQFIELETMKSSCSNFVSIVDTQTHTNMLCRCDASFSVSINCACVIFNYPCQFSAVVSCYSHRLTDFFDCRQLYTCTMHTQERMRNNKAQSDMESIRDVYVLCIYWRKSKRHTAKLHTIT